MGHDSSDSAGNFWKEEDLREMCYKISHMSKRSTVNSDLILRSSFGNVTKGISTVRRLYRWRGSLVPFCTTVRLNICDDTEALSGNLRRRGDQPHTSITWPRASRSFIYCLKWTPSPKKISGRRKYVTKNVAFELNSEFLWTPSMTALGAFLFHDYMF